jgi:hypothetical protein
MYVKTNGHIRIAPWITHFTKIYTTIKSKLVPLVFLQKARDNPK